MVGASWVAAAAAGEDEGDVVAYDDDGRDDGWRVGCWVLGGGAAEDSGAGTRAGVADGEGAWGGGGRRERGVDVLVGELGGRGAVVVWGGNVGGGGEEGMGKTKVPARVGG